MQYQRRQSSSSGGQFVITVFASRMLSTSILDFRFKSAGLKSSKFSQKRKEPSLEQTPANVTAATSSCDRRAAVSSTKTTQTHNGQPTRARSLSPFPQFPGQSLSLSLSLSLSSRLAPERERGTVTPPHSAMRPVLSRLFPPIISKRRPKKPSRSVT